MRVGFALGNTGPIGTADNLVKSPTFMPGAQRIDRWLGLMEEWRTLV